MERYVDALQGYRSAASVEGDGKSPLFGGGEVAMDNGGEVRVVDALGTCATAEFVAYSL